jgi:hypothetical protein
MDIDGARIACDENKSEATNVLLRLLSNCKECQEYLLADEAQLFRIFNIFVQLDHRKDTVIVYNRSALPQV